MNSESTVISRKDGCILASGPLSPEMLEALTKEAPEGAIIDPDVARLAGVGWAVGLPEDLAKMREALATEAVRPAIEGLSPGAIEWLAVGEHGLSSATLFWKVTGVRPGYLRDYDEDWVHHPHDPSDFNRCLLLIDMAPEIGAGLPVMRAASPEWAALVDHWD